MGNAPKISPALDRELNLASHQTKSNELRELAQNNPEYRNYIRKCLNIGIEVNDIIFEVKSSLALIELIGDDKELQELSGVISAIPSDKYKIVRGYTRLKEIAKEIPDIYSCLEEIKKKPTMALINTCFEKAEKLFSNMVQNGLNEAVKSGTESALQNPLITGPNSKNMVINESSDFDPENVDITTDQEGNTVYSFPIYILGVDKTPENRRIWKKICTHFLLDISEKYFKGFQLRGRMIISLFPSIIENSLDHSDGKIFFGLQVTTNSDGNMLKLSFIVADEGDGIYESVKKAEGKNVLSFEEAYEIAFTLGWSSIGTDRGKGLDWMRSLASGLNESVGTKVKVSIFDHGKEYKLDSPDRPELAETVFKVDPMNKFRVVGNITIQK